MIITGHEMAIGFLLVRHNMCCNNETICMRLKNLLLTSYRQHLTVRDDLGVYLRSTNNFFVCAVSFFREISIDAYQFVGACACDCVAFDLTKLLTNYASQEKYIIRLLVGKPVDSLVQCVALDRQFFF